MVGREAYSLPGTWRVARLGDVMRLGYGVPLPERDRRPGWVPVYGSAGRVGWHDSAEVKGPGIVVGRKGSIGSISWVREDFVPIDTTYFAAPYDGQANLRWLFHTLVREDLSTLNRATGVPGLNRDDVYALRRPLPPLPEQRAIAAVLDSIDEAIERSDEVIAATERLRNSLLHEFYTRGLPGHHAAWRDVPGLGTIPACWEVVRLGDVAEVKGGKRLPKGSSFAIEDTGLPYIRVVDFLRRSVDTRDLQFLRPDTHRAIKRYTIGAKDVYISIAGTIGLVGTIPSQLDGANLTENAAKIVPGSQERLLQLFLVSFLDSRPGRTQIGIRVNALGQPKLSLERIRTIPVPLPTLPEQQAIADTLDSVDAAIEGARAERLALQSSKVSTADALLTGRVRVGGHD